jgi:hypothetical protein
MLITIHYKCVDSGMHAILLHSVQIYFSKFKGLTYGLIGKKWHVFKAIDLCNIIKIRVLNNKTPLCVIHSIVEVDDCDLYTPIIFIVVFYMPMHANRTKVACTL